MIEVYKDILPNADLTLDLGSATKHFAAIYIETVNYATMNPASAVIPIAPVAPQTIAGSATFTNGLLVSYTAPS